MTAVSEKSAAGTPADGAPAAPVSLPRDPAARLTALFDPGTMTLLPSVAPDGSGAIAARGLIVGSYNEAIARGVPVIGLWHSGGARLAEGVASLHGVGTVFAAMTAASGVVPQISVVLGPAAGGAAYGPALTDVVILSRHGRIFVTGPDVVRSVTGEDVDMARLGGPEPHSRRSGVVHLVAEDDEAALGYARTLVALLSE